MHTITTKLLLCKPLSNCLYMMLQQYLQIYPKIVCVGISLYKINWVILKNLNLPLTCNINNMMCIDSNRITIGNQHEIWEFR